MSLPENHPRMTKRPFGVDELLADGIVHAVALLAGVVAFSVLLGQVLGAGRLGTFAALAVYAAGYFLMFGFSLAYNMAPPSPVKWMLRRFDHSAIFVMIAGTYTAVVIHFDSAVWAWALAVGIWVGAIGGAVVKFALPGRYDRLAVGFYILMGWAGVVATGQIYHALPVPSLILLLLGGVTYVAGVVFYRWHGLRFHNAIWHGFVLLAAGMHFAAIALAVAV